MALLLALLLVPVPPIHPVVMPEDVVWGLMTAFYLVLTPIAGVKLWRLLQRQRSAVQKRRKAARLRNSLFRSHQHRRG